MPTDGKRYIFRGDGKIAQVEAIGNFWLLLKIVFYLNLNETFILPFLDEFVPFLDEV